MSATCRQETRRERVKTFCEAADVRRRLEGGDFGVSCAIAGCRLVVDEKSCGGAVALNAHRVPLAVENREGALNDELKEAAQSTLQKKVSLVTLELPLPYERQTFPSRT